MRVSWSSPSFPSSADCSNTPSAPSRKSARRQPAAPKSMAYVRTSTPFQNESKYAQRVCDSCSASSTKREPVQHHAKISAVGSERASMRPECHIHSAASHGQPHRMTV